MSDLLWYMQLLGISRKGADNYRASIRSLLQGFELKPVFRTYSRFDEDVASNAVSFILSRDDVKFIAWGTRQVNELNFQS